MSNFKDYLREILKEAAEGIPSKIRSNTRLSSGISGIPDRSIGGGPESFSDCDMAEVMADERNKKCGGQGGYGTPTLTPCDTCPVPGDEDYCPYMYVPCSQGGGFCRSTIGGLCMTWTGCATDNSGWVPCVLVLEEQAPGLPDDWGRELYNHIKKRFPFLPPGFGPPRPPKCSSGDGQDKETLACNREWARFWRRMIAYLCRMMGLLGLDPCAILNLPPNGFLCTWLRRAINQVCPGGYPGGMPQAGAAGPPAG